MGADRGVLVKVDGDVEPLAVAKLIKAVADAEQPGLIILGKQAIDDDCKPDRPDDWRRCSGGRRARSRPRSN